jgi:fructose-bisphosphate aldolase class II
MNTLRDVLTQSERDGVALGHFNVANLVMLKAVLNAAGETHVPVLVGASEGERDFLGTLQLAFLVKSLREELDLEAFLWLARRKRLKRLRRCDQSSHLGGGRDRRYRNGL